MTDPAMAGPNGTPSSTDDAVGAARLPGGAASTHRGYINDKEKYLARLRRIEGQARGIHRMIDEEQYCIDILTQVSAMTSALENVAIGLLQDHLSHCVLDAAQSSEDAGRDKIEEAMAAITRLVRS